MNFQEFKNDMLQTIEMTKSFHDLQKSINLHLDELYLTIKSLKIDFENFLKNHTHLETRERGILCRFINRELDNFPDGKISMLIEKSDFDSLFKNIQENIHKVKLIPGCGPSAEKNIRKAIILC